MDMLRHATPFVTARQPFDRVGAYLHLHDGLHPVLHAPHRALLPGPGRLGDRGFHAFWGHRVPHHGARGSAGDTIHRPGEAPPTHEHAGRLTQSAAPDPLSGNHLLAALPRAAATCLLPQIEPVTWERGTVLYAPDDGMASLYFPTTALISLVAIMGDGATAAMGLIGNDGVVGFPLILGGTTTPHWAIVQVAGEAFRLAAAALHAEWRRGGAVQRALLRSTQALLTQMAQTAVCNRLHSLTQRLCRWLLFLHDRVPTDAVPITHEGLARMLGAYRESVSAVLRHLHAAGCIGAARGAIAILDRQGLEAMACECYRVVQDECTRLLRDAPAA